MVWSVRSLVSLCEISVVLVVVGCHAPIGDGVDGSTGDAPVNTGRRVVVATGPDPSSPAHLKIFDASGGMVADLTDAFNDPGLRYGVNVASCDLDGDGLDEIIVAPGPSPVSGPRLRVLDNEGKPSGIDLGSVFDASMRYGVEVACGDLDGDGEAKVVVAPGPDPLNSAEIRVFSRSGLRTSFLAFPTEVRYGAHVAIGDVDGDGHNEIVVAPGPAPSSGSHIKVFSPDGTLRSEFHAFDDSLLFGAQIAVGDVDGDGRAEIIVAPGPQPLAPAKIRTFAADGTLRGEFEAPDIAPHLTGYGYFHVHDPNFGLHLPEVADFTNLAHIWRPEYVATAASLHVGAVLDLEQFVASQPEATWAQNIAAVGAMVGPDHHALAAIYVVDEPDGRGWDDAKQARAVAAVKAVFPDVPAVITYTLTSSVPPAQLD
jgi:hypothetical protein